MNNSEWAVMYLGVDASPSGGGRTAVAVQCVLDAISGPTRLLSITEDGGDAVVRALPHAQALVLGTPVYRGTMSWTAKKFLDIVPRGGPADGHDSPLRAMPVVVVTTSASDHHFLANRGLAGVLYDFFAAWVVPPGLHFTHASFDDHREVRPPWREQCATAAEVVVSLVQATDTFGVLRRVRPPV